MFQQTDELNQVDPKAAELAIVPDYDYSIEDFYTPEPYEKLYELQKAPFVYRGAKAKMEANAKAVGFKGFNGMLKDFIKSQLDAKRRNMIPNQTEFEDQVMELTCGIWEATDWGIFRDTPNGGRECACAHPIMPIERLVNIDTGEVKLKLWFKRSGRDQKSCTTIVDKSTVSTSRNITALSSQGISVTSSTASALVDYINDMENINYDIIPETKSIGRLGYIPGEGFSPYVEDLVFDGDAGYRDFYGFITERGSYTEWYRAALECRQMSVTARILLAASFASPILSLVGSLPFFVHMWGGTGTGKSVALILAASVWGAPAIGEYVQTFNATQVGQERTAAFLNHLPYCMDELQLTKDSRGRTNFDVYQLAQGVGRTRGNRSGGMDRAPTWCCCFLTTGEDPLTNSSSGGGAVNRVIDVDCTTMTVITDAARIAGILKRNHGFAGREFVERLYRSEKVMEQVRSIYQDFFKELCLSDSTEKQAMAAAAILTADALATTWIFKDDMALNPRDIKEFLASREAVSAGKRAYDWLCDWVASNANHFLNDDASPSGGELYGALDDGMAYIIRGVFDKALQDVGYSTSATLSYLRANRLIETRSGKGYTKTKRIGRTTPQCVWLRLEAPHDAAGEEMLPL